MLLAKPWIHTDDKLVVQLASAGAAATSYVRVFRAVVLVRAHGVAWRLTPYDTREGERRTLLLLHVAHAVCAACTDAVHAQLQCRSRAALVSRQHDPHEPETVRIRRAPDDAVHEV